MKPVRLREINPVPKTNRRIRKLNRNVQRTRAPRPRPVFFKVLKKCQKNRRCAPKNISSENGEMLQKCQKKSGRLRRSKMQKQTLTPTPLIPGAPTAVSESGYDGSEEVNRNLIRRISKGTETDRNPMDAVFRNLMATLV